MNRKKTIDYTVTRRPRERDSSKFRQDSSSREARGRDDGNSRSKTPFWSNNDNNLGSQANFSTLQMLDKLKDMETGSLYDRKRNPLLSNLQKEISRDVPSQHDRDKFGTFGKVIGSGFSRGQSRGPIIDVFSEDSHSLYSDSNSKRTDSSNSKDWQHRRTDKNDSQRKRSHSPDDELLSSNWRIREDTTTKCSHSKSLNPSSQCMDEDVDLRSVLKQFQKSRWEDNSEDVFDSGFSADYRDDDHQRKKGPYDDSVKGSDCREPRDSLRTR